jgi:hypothetical protein
VAPLKAMAAELRQSVTALTELGVRLQALLADAHRAEAETVRWRSRDRLERRLDRYSRVQRMVQQIRLVNAMMPANQAAMHEAVADLHAALAPVPLDELRACRALADTNILANGGLVLTRAEDELTQAKAKSHRDLEALEPTAQGNA